MTTPRKLRNNNDDHDPRCPAHLRSKLGIKTLPIKSLNVDRYDHANDNSGYQRPLRITAKEAKAHPFRQELCSVIDVAIREDGTYWIVDGQQRTERARLCNVSEIQCKVSYSSGQQEEAERFVRCNQDRKSMRPEELWIGDRIAKNPIVLAADEAARKYGIEILGTASVWKTIKCVNCIRGIVNSIGITGFEKILKIVTTMWPKQDGITNENTLKAMSILLKIHPGLNIDAFIEKIKKKDLEVYARLAYNKHIKIGGTGYSRYQYLADELKSAYNNRQRNNRFPD